MVFKWFSSKKTKNRCTGTFMFIYIVTYWCYEYRKKNGVGFYSFLSNKYLTSIVRI